MMIIIKFCVCFVVVLQLFLTIGCSNSEVRNDSVIKDTVKLYNALLAEGYRELNMNSLKQVATEERVMKAYFHMAAIVEGQVKMDARLDKLEFLSVINVSEKRADVRTEENWHYVYKNIVSGEINYENSVSYLLTYQLVKQSERWQVDEIIIEQSEEGQGVGEIPFVERSPGLPKRSSP